MKACAIAFAVLGAASLSFAGDFPVGSKVTEITVKDNATPVVVAPSKAKATVIIFVSTKCPISNAYNERMNALYQEYKAKDVQFTFVNANVTESPAEIEEHSKANKLTFKVYKDVGNVLADKFNAQSTPETYVFDQTGVLQYHGYIDDAQNVARVHVQGLRKALDAVLAGQAPETKETKAFGCTIKRARTT